LPNINFKKVKKLFDTTMIQRVQSIFLFLVGVSMVLALSFPFWKKQDTASKQEAVMSAFHLVHRQDGQVKTQSTTVYLAVLAFASATVAFGSLFSYKKRLLQIQLNLVNTLLLVGMMALSVYFIFSGEKFFLQQQKGHFGLAFYMPAAALFFNSLANRFIRRDEKMVRDAYRLR
jgi:glucan phosphoethanolaminetransferase (alkaline phosphatase superfamily)